MTAGCATCADHGDAALSAGVRAGIDGCACRLPVARLDHPRIVGIDGQRVGLGGFRLGDGVVSVRVPAGPPSLQLVVLRNSRPARPCAFAWHVEAGGRFRLQHPLHPGPLAHPLSPRLAASLDLEISGASAAPTAARAAAVYGERSRGRQASGGPSGHCAADPALSFGVRTAQVR